MMVLDRHDVYLENFLKERKLLSVSSIREYEGKLRRYFSRYPTVSAQNIVQFLGTLHVKDRTRNHYLTIIRIFAEYLADMGIISHGELKKIKKLKIRVDQGRKPPQKWALTDEQIKKSLSVLVNPRLWMLFWVGAHYGLRAQEYRNLRLPDIDLENELLVIRQSKGNKTRRIPILSSHEKVWLNWLSYREQMNITHDHVFFSKTGKLGKRTLERDFNEISTILTLKGIVHPSRKVTSHTLRYTYATKLYLKTRNLELVREMLGHSSITTTQKYLSLTEKEYFSLYREALE